MKILIFLASKCSVPRLHEQIARRSSLYRIWNSRIATMSLQSGMLEEEERFIKQQCSAFIITQPYASVRFGEGLKKTQHKNYSQIDTINITLSLVYSITLP